ncbi:DUF6894 family protein [Methylobacterium sp. CM6257]
MPRFYFNVHGGRSELDADGTKLISREAARVAALQMAGEILKDEAHWQRHGETWRLEVSDETERVVCCIAVSISDLSADG